MRPRRHTDQIPAAVRTRACRDDGGAMSGLLVAVLVLAAVAVGAFFYFGGRADVNIKEPNVRVSSSETPK